MRFLIKRSWDSETKSALAELNNQVLSTKITLLDLFVINTLLTFFYIQLTQNLLFLGFIFLGQYIVLGALYSLLGIIFRVNKL